MESLQFTLSRFFFLSAFIVLKDAVIFKSKVVPGSWEVVHCECWNPVLPLLGSVTLGNYLAYLCLFYNIGIIIVLFIGLLNDFKHAKHCEKCIVRAY